MLTTDSNGNIVQGFAPKKVLACTGGVAWNVDTLDMAFRVPTAVGYTINGAGATASLGAGTVTVLSNNVTSITFTSDVTIEVM